MTLTVELTEKKQPDSSDQLACCAATMSSYSSLRLATVHSSSTPLYHNTFVLTGISHKTDTDFYIFLQNYIGDRIFNIASAADSDKRPART